MRTLNKSVSGRLPVPESVLFFMVISPFPVLSILTRGQDESSMASHISIKMLVLYVAVSLSASLSLHLVCVPMGEQQAL